MMKLLNSKDAITMILGIILIGTLSFLLFAVYQKTFNVVCKSKRRLVGKTAIVTGGTSGIGLEVAKDFAQRGARVIIACPFEDEGLSAQRQIVEESGNKNVVFKILDLGSLESTRTFAAEIIKSEHRLDILINNAGITADSVLTKDGLNLTMQVNYFGAFLLTILLLPLLRKTGKPEDPSRIINTASELHLFGSVNVKELNKALYHIPNYARSKLCLMLFTHELNKKIKGWNVVVNSLQPGTVGTKIYSGWHKYVGVLVTFLIGFLLKTPKEGAQTTIHAAVDEKAGQVSGVYFSNCKVTKSSKKSHDDKLAEELWLESVRLVKLSDSEGNDCFK